MNILNEIKRITFEEKSKGDWGVQYFMDDRSGEMLSINKTVFELARAVMILKDSEAEEVLFHVKLLLKQRRHKAT